MDPSPYFVRQVSFNRTVVVISAPIAVNMSRFYKTKNVLPVPCVRCRFLEIYSIFYRP